MPHTHPPEPEDKKLAAIKPEIQKSVTSWWQKTGPNIKQVSRGTLMGGLLAAIVTPLFGLETGLAAAFLKTMGSIGEDLAANFIQRFYDAGDDPAAQQKVLQDLERFMQTEDEKTNQLLVDLQNVIEKIDALTAIQQELGEELAQQFRQALLAPRPIPADDDAHREFARQVGNILRLASQHVQEGFMLSDAHRADFLVTDLLRGRPVRTVVQCVTTKQGRADEELLPKLLHRLPAAITSKKVDGGELITDCDLSTEAHSLAEDTQWTVRRYDDLIAELMDFSLYLDDLIRDVEDPSATMPALKDYFVPLKVLPERERSEGAAPLPLSELVQQWIDAETPQNPLMLLGEYGTGKTTFSRMLACELAKRCRRAQDSALAGHPPGKRPRIPILINLLDYTHTSKLEALIGWHLSERCHVSNPKYRLFEEMNKAGLFVIILDGFDEMAVRADSRTIERQLTEIERLLVPDKARVILTGRPEFFMSREELEKAMWRHGDRLSDRFKNYDAYRLTLWDDDQIDLFLQQLVPQLTGGKGDWQNYRRRIRAIPGFGEDLEQRAVLLEMIVKTLPDFAEGETIDRVSLYQRYLQKELERQRVKKRRELLLEDSVRFALLQRLAVESYSAENGGISYAAAREQVVQKLPPEEKISEEKIAHNTRDFLQCSFLKPGTQDVFIFSHRSFRGYFAAKELAPQLLDGSARPQPIDQDCIRFLAEMLEEECTPEFYRGLVQTALTEEGLPDWIIEKDDRYFSSLPGGLLVEMVYVPPGPFVLGAEGELQPQIAVLEKGLWLDRTPVTNEQYKQFLEKNRDHPPPKGYGPWQWYDRNYPEGAADHPVVNVSWHDAQAFCKWAGKALPQEQQWEKAARGIDGRTWSWGSQWDREKCNSASFHAGRDLHDYEKEWKPWWEKEFPQKYDGKIMTTPVGHFAAHCSPFGCLDAAGNVWEWCADLWKEDSNARVLRGGAWSYPPHLVACAIRYSDYPDGRNDYIGFRCART